MFKFLELGAVQRSSAEQAAYDQVMQYLHELALRPMDTGASQLQFPEGVSTEAELQLRQRQLQLEQESIQEARHKALRQQEQMRTHNLEAQRIMSQKLEVQWSTVLAKSIAVEQVQCANRVGGIGRSVYAPYVLQLMPQQLAKITIRETLALAASVQTGARLLNVVTSIGEACERQVAFDMVSEAAGKERVDAEARNSDVHHLNRIRKKAAKGKAGKGSVRLLREAEEADLGWPTFVKARLGSVLLQLFLDTAYVLVDSSSGKLIEEKRLPAELAATFTEPSASLNVYQQHAAALPEVNLNDAVFAKQLEVNPGLKIPIAVPADVLAVDSKTAALRDRARKEAAAAAAASSAGAGDGAVAPSSDAAAATGPAASVDSVTASNVATASSVSTLTQSSQPAGTEAGLAAAGAGDGTADVRTVIDVFDQSSLKRRLPAVGMDEQLQATEPLARSTFAMLGFQGSMTEEQARSVMREDMMVDVDSSSRGGTATSSGAASSSPSSSQPFVPLQPRDMNPMTRANDMKERERGKALRPSGDDTDLLVRHQQMMLQKARQVRDGAHGKDLASIAASRVQRRPVTLPDGTRAMLVPAFVTDYVWMRRSMDEAELRNSTDKVKLLRYHAAIFAHPRLTEILTAKVVSTAHQAPPPMVVKPKPWQSLSQGPYETIFQPLVRTDRVHKRILKDCLAEEKKTMETRRLNGMYDRPVDANGMPIPRFHDVLAGLDILGHTPWRINSDVVRVVHELWPTDGEKPAVFKRDAEGKTLLDANGDPVPMRVAGMPMYRTDRPDYPLPYDEFMFSKGLYKHNPLFTEPSPSAPVSMQVIAVPSSPAASAPSASTSSAAVADAGVDQRQQAQHQQPRYLPIVPSDVNPSLQPGTREWTEESAAINMRIRDEKRKWTRAVNSATSKDMDGISLRSSFNLALHRALVHEKDAQIYFPHNLDFRGRVYPIPPHLNHMGSDFARSTLKFAKGVELGSSGERWLKVHLSNLMGFDKASFADRAAYVDSKAAAIMRVAADPCCSAADETWLKADSPFQALAVCKELATIWSISNPEARSQFKSHLPVHQDGSCNGLQHYAALGRDRDGGAAVNLVDAALPGDVYSRVLSFVNMRIDADFNLALPPSEEVIPNGDRADNVREDFSIFARDYGSNLWTKGYAHYDKVGIKFQSGNTYSGQKLGKNATSTIEHRCDLEVASRPLRYMCAKFLKGRVDRKTVKQTVMTSVYGVTYLGGRDQILNRLREKWGDMAPGDLASLWPGKTSWTSDDRDYLLEACAQYLSRCTLTSLGDVFKNAQGIMSWLADVAGAITSQNQAVSWVSPLGMPIIQPYWQVDQSEVAFWSESTAGSSVAGITAAAAAAAAKGNGGGSELDSYLELLLEQRQQQHGNPISAAAGIKPNASRGASSSSASSRILVTNDDYSAAPVSKAKQRSAFPPNFIHSLDSTHMFMTAEACNKAGITFAAVHDSYWTHAAHVDQMRDILRDRFVALYSKPILSDLKRSIELRYPALHYQRSAIQEATAALLELELILPDAKTPAERRVITKQMSELEKVLVAPVVPELPPTGDLDLEEVRRSTYFFS